MVSGAAAVVWWLLPVTLISLGTSKLFYYAYPFLPPLFIGAGLVSSAALRRGSRAVSSLLVAGSALAGFRGMRAAAWQARG